LRSRLVSIICLAGLLPACCIAQQHAPSVDRTPVTPSLHEILLHLQQNLSDYLANVPSFFCDEHVISDINLPNRKRIFRTTTDSTFSLRRSAMAGKPNALSESREVKRVNGAPAIGGNIQGPAIFTGAFSGALSVVSIEMSRCYDYALEPMGQLDTVPVIAISYVTKPKAGSNPFCPGPEKESGRAWIDPVTFHLLRVEMRTPNHKMDPTTAAMWTWAVDYAPITFDNKLFWMPKTISTRARANDIPVVWSFCASYGNYHKLNVTSHIITDTEPAPLQ
jgi:hypothetical protein